MITVIDYGMGNLRSVVKAFELYSDSVRISQDPSDLKTSKAVVLPGDGAFAMAMENFKKAGWIDAIRDYISSGGYFMGICLGFQLLFSTSEEFGKSEGLNVIEGDVVRFNSDTLKVPHMGWNTVSFRKKSKFFEGIPDSSYFYFIHSYYPEVHDEKWIAGESEYGLKFPCIVSDGNLIATQFHPEKSHTNGLKIIENFVRLSC